MQFRQLILLTLFCSANNFLFAQSLAPTGSDKTQHISLNLLSPFISTLNLSYERKVNDDEAMIFNAFYFYGDVYAPLEKPRMISLAVGYKYYISDAFPKGLFVQPYARYAHFWSANPVITSTPNITNEKYNFLAAGILIGQQYALKDRVTFQYFGGPYYSVPLNNIEEFKGFRPLNGGFFTFGASVGFLIK